MDNNVGVAAASCFGPIYNSIVTHPFIPGAVWLVLYSLDYYLTLIGASLAKRQNALNHRGSYELNPMYVSDVDSGAIFSWLFVFWLCIVPAGFVVAHDMAGETVVYPFLLGLTLIPELNILVRHFINLAMYRRLVRHPELATGSVYFVREFAYLRSADMLAFDSVALLCLFLITMNPILCGGCVALAAYSRWQRGLARQASIAKTGAEAIHEP